MKKAAALTMTLSLSAALALSACADKAPAGSASSGAPERLPELGVELGSAVPAPSETERYPELEELIADAWAIPAESRNGTRYYYHYADLNGDGQNEVLALAVGDYTSGSGGSSMMIVRQEGGRLERMQDFAAVNPPVIVSDTRTDGWADLLVPAEDGWKALTWAGTEYRALDGAAEFSGEGPAGTAIFYNDLSADLDDPDALRLG